MCGIVGFNWHDQELLEKMMAAVVHRGPDESGCYLDDRVSLGHQRLKIIDLLTGKQPIHNEDNSLHIVFNGEIYNYLEIKQGLLQKGHHFYTGSDTEVVLHAYEEYGIDCVAYFNGIFAFAVWDSNNKRLLLARDRLGIKPLYYYARNGRFIFASEIKAILASGLVSRDVDRDALNEFLTFRYVPSHRTLIQSIYKLPPAHTMTLNGGEIRLSQYWDIKEQITGKSEGDYAAQLRSLLRQAVRQQLVSDVPLGLSLSGGLDSTSVLALMSENTSNIKTFAVGFGAEGESELGAARFAADYFGTDHHEIEVTEKDLDLLSEMVWHLEEPIGDAATLPTYILAKFAKKQVTVLLAGEGGDELFAGYDNYKLMMQGNRLSRLVPSAFKYNLIPSIASRFNESSNVRRALEFTAIEDKQAQYLSLLRLFTEAEQKKLGINHSDGSGNYFPNNMELLNRLLYFGIKTWLPNDFFMKADKMTMAHAVEERVPILDHNIVEFAFTIPPGLKLKGTNGKYIFKKAMAGLVPQQIIKRRKRGYNAPMDYWFKHSLKNTLEQLLHESKHNYYNKEYILKLLADFQGAGRAYALNFPNAQKLWSILVFEIWHRLFIEKRKFETL